jgi:serine/threonine-protein kinase
MSRPVERTIEIQARSEAPPLGDTRAIPSVSGLPPDLVAQSARRLGIASLVWAALWSFALLMNNVVAPVVSPDKPLDDAWPWPGNPVAILVVLLSLLVFVHTRRQRLVGTRALDVGLGYEIAIALAIGVVNQWTPNVTGLSWICVLVVTHPVIVPNTRRKTLIAALAAASMDPVGLLLTGARGVELPEFSALVWAYVPNYICAFLAVLPSHVIRRLGQQVSSARRLGSYQLGERVGRGGMGEVYRATHRMLARPAAIKLIRPEMLGTGSPQAARALAQRFQREANAAALLCSPHTIDLYDFGVAEDGTLFYVMELLEGVDLRTLVKRFGPVPAARAIHFLQQACRSLAEAHARGLVHRDIKPSNIHACRFGLEVDFLKVLDFGLVRLEEPGLDVHATIPGVMAGTPSFMAPEQALGRAVDRRADLYSLGCVAYWLLTGRLVFEAETPVQMLERQMDAVPDPPSRHAELHVPDQLDALILSCLAKKPADRPRDAAELSVALAACAVSEAWTAERAQHWWDLHLPHTAFSAMSVKATAINVD